MNHPGADHHESPHRLVRASAGSGKTFQLTNKYLRLLLIGENPGDLLATTFTRAAAGEILHRALARLADAALDDRALEELRAHVAPDLTRARAAETLSRVVGSLHRLSIMTIDAFFARLASSFALEIGVPPGWRVLDEEEDALVRAAAADDAFREADHAELLSIIRDLHGERARTDAHAALMSVVRDGYTAYLATLGDDSSWRAIGAIGRAISDADLDAAIARLTDDLIPTTKAGSPRKYWVNAFDSVRDCVLRRDWLAIVNITLIKRIAGFESVFDRAEIEDAHRLALAPFIEHARHVLTRDHAARTMATRRILDRFDTAYTRAKRARAGVTFDDPPRLLLAAGTTGMIDRMHDRLDARLRHVLLDEFQDTSMTQFRLLEPVLDELLSQRDAGRSVFCVGDIKQSLYSWRGAEPVLLPALAERWPAFVTESLSVSWRSAPIVLGAVNTMFAHAASNPALVSREAALAAARAWDGAFDTHAAAPPNAAMPGSVRLSVADEEADADTSRRAVRRALLTAAARRVAEARASAPGASIAVLVRRNADIRVVLERLRDLDIDATEQRGNPLADSPPVAAAASLLRLIDHPGHTAALRHVCMTPLGDAARIADVSPARLRARLARLRRRIAERGCAPLLSSILARCSHAVDERGVRRFLQFIDLADNFDIAQRGGPADLADLAETRPIDEPGRSPVRVMTIHAAKGLEFDAVVVPLAADVWNVNPRALLAGRDEPLGPITRVSRYPSEPLRLLHPDLESLHAETLGRQIIEELCCLYVAATRARRSLELIVPADKPGRSGEPLAPDDWSATAANYVRGALAPDSPATPGAELWSRCSERDWFDDDSLAHPRAEHHAAAPARERMPLRVRPGADRPAARLARAAPSSVGEDRPIPAASVLARHDREARAIGSIVHHWFEQIEWLADAPDEAALVESAARAGFDESLARRAAPTMIDALRRDSIRAALSLDVFLAREPIAEAADVNRERAFIIRDPASPSERLLQGRFDRLVIARAAGRAVRAEVVDFKTDRVPTEADISALAEAVEHHRPQMEAYRRAAAAMLRLPVSATAATLIFTSVGEAVRLPYEG